MSETVPPVSRLLDLTGRVALVTGASGGVDSGIAQRFAEAGAAVVVHYRSDARGATAVVDAVRAAGGRAEAVDAELGERSSVTRLAAAADHFGELDSVVDNAGAYRGTRVAPVLDARLQPTASRSRAR